MFCTNCGKEIKDNSNFCIHCGAKISHINDLNNSQNLNNTSNVSNSSSNTNKGKNRGFVIAIIAILIILMLAFVFLIKVFLIDRQNNQIDVNGSYNQSMNDNHIDDTIYDSNYSLSFVSSDMNNYPNVRLYYRILDNNGNIINDFNIKDAKIKEKTISGEYINREIKIKELIGNSYGLNTSMVIDKSGSISDTDMEQIKYVVKTFVGSMNFNVGDKSEIITFDTDINVLCDYTNNLQVLSNSVDAVYPGGGTALYDAIYSGILHASNEGSARCVIAFTDGEDNDSYYKDNDVINFAIKQQVPVYIIGVGSSLQENILINIADSTNGKYWNINDLQDLYSIFSEIYEREKSTYFIEYETTISGDEKYDIRTIDIEISDDTYHMHSEDTFAPVLPERIGNDATLSINKRLELMKTIGEYSVDTDIDDMDTISFGHYEQDGDIQNGMEDIEWILLDRSNGKVLLMSKIIIENYIYNLNAVDNYWENSNLRQFMNGDCYNVWFNDSEKRMISDANVATLDATGNYRYTNDKLFVLSEDECRKYFGYEDTNGHNKRIATHITPYLKMTRNNITIEAKEVWYKGNSSFWLRDAGTKPTYVKYVGLAGKLHPEGDTVLENDGIRPALWVDYR